MVFRNGGGVTAPPAEISFIFYFCSTGVGPGAIIVKHSYHQNLIPNVHTNQPLQRLLTVLLSFLNLFFRLGFLRLVIQPSLSAVDRCSVAVGDSVQ